LIIAESLAAEKWKSRKLASGKVQKGILLVKCFSSKEEEKREKNEITKTGRRRAAQIVQNILRHGRDSNDRSNPSSGEGMA